MTESRDRVAILVLTWEGREDTLACLESLRAVTYPATTVVVIDNGSTDGTSEAVRERYPDVVLLRSKRNVGFPAGMNIGVRHALGELAADHVLLLNNDTLVDPRFVEPLVEAVGAYPRVAAVCSKIFFLDAPDRIWFAGAPLNPNRGFDGRLWGYGEHDSQRFTGVYETGRTSGTSMLVPALALRDVGEYDEDFFLYVEDIDWSLRARANGYRLLVAADSRVWHRVATTSGGEGSPTTLYYSVRNGLATRERHAPMGRVRTWARRTELVAAHGAQALRAGFGREGIAAVAEGWRDFRRGRWGRRGTGRW